MFARFSFIIMALLLPMLAWAQPTVSEIRLGHNDGESRMVLEVSESVTPKVFTLPNPPRLVIDLPTLRMKADVKKVKIPPESLVQGIRASQFNDKVFRIVVDLNTPVNHSHFTIPPTRNQPLRVVFDMKPRDGKATKAENKPAVTADGKTRVTLKKEPAGNKKPIIVVIDPGHGGVDPGAIGRAKNYEKNVVLQVSRRIRDAINAKPGMKAYLTRDRDVFLRLADRVEKAQRLKADIFVSIHADAHENRSVSGSSVYVLSETSSDREAERLAKLANEGYDIGGITLESEPVEVRNILIDLAQRDTMNHSALLARHVLDDISGVTRTRGKKIRFAGFRVLKALQVPSILVELAYLSNPQEERMLTDSRQQQRMAQAIANGVERYIKDPGSGL